MTDTIDNLVTAPPKSPVGSLGWLRASLGGVLGISLSGSAGLLALNGIDMQSLPWLVAPVGASAVLVFAVPASPLAQPWPVIGGNILSALIGFVLGHVLGVPLLAAALAVGAAITAMSLARCLHPPGGACALLYALGAAGTPAWGSMHLLVILVNVVALASTGWVYNRLTGHSWPHRPVQPRAAVRLGSRAAAIHKALNEVMAERDEVIDADVDDLDAIFQEVERRIRSTEQDAPPASVI